MNRKINETENRIVREIEETGVAVNEQIPSIRALQATLKIPKNQIMAAVDSLCDKQLIARAGTTRQGYLLKKPVTSGVRELADITIQYFLPFASYNYTVSSFMANFESLFSKRQCQIFFANTNNLLSEETRLLQNAFDGEGAFRPSYMFLTSCDSIANPNLPLLYALNRQCPIILLDRLIRGADFDYIGFDHFRTGYHTSQYLTQLGHRSMTYVRGYNKISSVQDRYLGFLSGMRDCGIPYDECRTFSLSKNNIGSIPEIQDDVNIIGEKILALKPLPTAVVCSFDRIAVALIHFFLKKGLSVPEDISVIGCDNDKDIIALSPVAVSTYSQPVQLCAEEALSLVLSRQKFPNKEARTVLFHTEFIPNHSTGPAPVRAQP